MTDLELAQQELAAACVAAEAAHVALAAVNKEMSEVHDRALAARQAITETDRAVHAARHKVRSLSEPAEAPEA